MNRPGLGLVNISGASGADAVSDGRGSALADLDNDGDLDVVLMSWFFDEQQVPESAVTIYRNNVGADQGFLRVTLRGTTSGPDAFGAVVRVETSAGVLTKHKSGGSGIYAQNDSRLLFGLGRDASAQSIEVAWPSGRTDRYGSIPAGASVLLTEGSSTATPVDELRFSLPDPLTDAQLRWRATTMKPGMRVPTVALTDDAGEPSSLRQVVASAGRGGPVVVNLWATWCSACKREMPTLDALHTQGVAVVGVHVGEAETQTAVPSVGYPSFSAAESALEPLFKSGSVEVPTTLIVAPDGRLADIAFGWSAAVQQEIEALRPE